MEQLYALIMAGGGGTRLWPESRSAFPKQLIRLFGQRSLIQIAFDRITPLIPAERVLVVTGQRYVRAIQEQIPALPVENIIVEPAGKNTAPAVGLGAIHLRQRDPAAIMAVLTADHVMREEEAFREALATAVQAVAGPSDEDEAGWILTLGITPSGPETGYGYIERAEPLVYAGLEGQPIFRVERFREKPDQATAERFVSSGRFYWNSGMFVWRASTVLAEIERQMPELHRVLARIEAVLGSPQEADQVRELWAEIRPVSIDYGVMEGARNVAVLPVDPGWSDVGSWRAVYEQSAKTDSWGNVVQGGQLLAIDTENCLVRGKKLVAIIGLQDLMIIETEDALLIGSLHEAQRVRDVVNLLKEEGLESCL